eukprot:scaffold25042_cov357-Cylindrotheca_fusiformis.AAC.1
MKLQGHGRHWRPISLSCLETAMGTAKVIILAIAFHFQQMEPSWPLELHMGTTTFLYSGWK